MVGTSGDLPAAGVAWRMDRAVGVTVHHKANACSLIVEAEAVTVTVEP